MTNNDNLRRLIKSAGVTRQEAADMIRTPITTLNKWMLPPGGSSYREAPYCCVELLRRELLDRELITADLLDTAEGTRQFTLIAADTTNGVHTTDDGSLPDYAEELSPATFYDALDSLRDDQHIYCYADDEILAKITAEYGID